jgi:hypothetical protein
MNLTAEEIALIEQKRAEEKTKQEELRKSYDHYREKTITYYKARRKEQEENEEERKASYEGIFNKLVAVSKDFKFICKKESATMTVNLYEIDDNGYEIKFTRNEDGSYGHMLDSKEVVDLETYRYVLKIVYTGKVPEGCEYYIVPVAQKSKYGNRVIGYKMQLKGSGPNHGIDNYDGRGKLSNAKSLHNRITETVDSVFRQIEYRKAQDNSNARILAKFKEEFGGYEFNNHQNEFTIKFTNGIALKVHGYENAKGDIEFRYSSVSVPYSQVDFKDLVHHLSAIKKAED